MGVGGANSLYIHTFGSSLSPYRVRSQSQNYLLLYSLHLYMCCTSISVYVGRCVSDKDRNIYTHKHWLWVLLLSVRVCVCCNIGAICRLMLHLLLLLQFIISVVVTVAKRRQRTATLIKLKRMKIVSLICIWKKCFKYETHSPVWQHKHVIKKGSSNTENTSYNTVSYIHHRNYLEQWKADEYVRYWLKVFFVIPWKLLLLCTTGKYSIFVFACYSIW